MRNPLLRTTNVISALFHAGAVVTESEADRAFYDEINHRLQIANGTGASGVNFLFAQNKQTTHMIARPLRKLGIPTAVVVDMDFVKEGGKNFTNLLDAVGIPKAWHQPLGTTRGAVKDALDSASPSWKTGGGISVLTGSDAQTCHDFISHLSEYGLFVVPTGELEGWLSSLGVRRSKNVWLYGIFEKMGPDPELPGYVLPTPGDVWEFMRKIANWIRNPSRKGMSIS